MSYFDSELTDRAVEAHYRRLRAEGYEDEQILIPSRALTERRGSTITIANTNGVLAKYRVVKRGGVERVRFVS